MRFLALLLLLACGASAWGTTYHLCPDVDATNTDINYGTEDGSSQVNCYDGFADAATTNVVAPGDTIVLHGTFYSERAYAWVSGTKASPITFECGTDCQFWFSNSVAGNNTTATSAASPPFGPTTGSSWQLVAGTTNTWKKGVGNGPTLMWVNGVRVPNVAVVPATQDEAGALASITGDNQFTSVTTALDGFNTTLYYRGALSSDMRVENRANYLQPDAMGNVLVNGKDYITWVTPRIRGFRANVNEMGALFVQNCTGCTVQGPVIYESGTPVKAQANTDLFIMGTDSAPCDIYDNIFGGINLGGQHELTASTRAPLLITAISNGANGQLDTNQAHGLTNGEIIVIQQATGLTALNGVEKTVTVVDTDSFTIATDTTAMGTYTANTGIIYALRTDTGTTVQDCFVHDNGNYPRYGLTSISFVQDADGLGVGYFGGTVNALEIIGNSFWRNGPRQALKTGETGDISRGSGVLISTSYTMAVNGLSIAGNDFWQNHRYSLNIDDTLSGQVVSNLFRGVVSYSTTAADAGQFRWFPAAGTNPYLVANNYFAGESGSYGFFPQNSQAASVWTVANNVFGDLTKSPLATQWHASLYVFSTNANITEKHNKFLTAPSDGFFKRSTTQYTTVAAWQAASGQGVNDEIVTDPGWVGGRYPTSIKGLDLLPTSAFIGAGAFVGLYPGYNCGFEPRSPDIGPMARCAGSPRGTALPARTTPLGAAP